MDNYVYISQREAIDHNALKKGISAQDVIAYTNRSLERARRDWPGQSTMWYLSLVENRTWENFFPGEPFPGKMSLADKILTMKSLPKKVELVDSKPNAALQAVTDARSVLTPIVTTKPIVKIEPVVKIEHDLEDKTVITSEFSRIVVAPRQSSVQCTSNTKHSRSTDMDWVHDLYDGDRGSGRNERSTGDYWPSRATGSSRDGDFYRPNEVRGSENSRRGETSKSQSSALEETKEHYGRLSHPNLDIINPTNLSTVDAKYESQVELIWNNTKALGVTPRLVEQAFEEESAKVKTSYSVRGNDWQKWAVEWAVWSRFFKKGRFPGTEPIGAGKFGRSTSSKDRTDNAVKPAKSLDTLSTKNTEVIQPKQVYYMQEQTMEALAIQRHIRSDFFSFLQKARDQARFEHRDCTPEIRHYVADKLTWKKFFSDRPFMGIEPKEGHSPICRNRLLGISPPNAPRGGKSATFGIGLPAGPPRSAGVAPIAGGRGPAGLSQFRQPSLTSKGIRAAELKAGENAAPAVSTQVGFIDTQPSLNMLAALGIARHNTCRDESRGGIIMVGSNAVWTEARKASEIYDHLIAGNSKVFVIRETLQCTFRYHRTSAGGYLLLWATSDHNDFAAVERGQAFLQGWISRALGSGMIRPFSYWNEMCLGMFSPIKKVANKAHDFQAVNACWDEYKNLIGAGLVDCLLVEEKAKSEGDVRMVLDKVSGEVVTVKELLKRHEYRSSSDGRTNPTLAFRSVSGGAIGEKRKMERDGDGDEIPPDPDAKRLCV